jgi:hypothetical protein
MPVRELLVLSFLVIVIGGGWGWTIDQLREWAREREEER